MKGSSLEAIPILLELFGHWFSFLCSSPEQAFTLPCDPASPNTKIRGRGREGKERKPVSTRHSRMTVSCLWQAPIYQTWNCLLSPGEEAGHGRQVTSHQVQKASLLSCLGESALQLGADPQVLASAIRLLFLSSQWLPGRGRLRAQCPQRTAPTGVPCHLSLTSPSSVVDTL